MGDQNFLNPDVLQTVGADVSSGRVNIKTLKEFFPYVMQCIGDPDAVVKIVDDQGKPIVAVVSRNMFSREAAQRFSSFSSDLLKHSPEKLAEGISEKKHDIVAIHEAGVAVCLAVLPRTVARYPLLFNSALRF
jgi:hypothetical protein